VIRGSAIEHEVVLAHPPERVWRALADPAELGAWLMPNDFRAEPGHRFTLDARPELGFVDGEVLEARPPRLLRCRWSGVFGDTVVTFELAPAGRGTRLRVTHSGWADERRGQRDGFDQGWHDKLAKDLPALLAGDGTVRPAR
jgi:uncharacterized protein YndB with AHSA1/START domain